MESVQHDHLLVVVPLVGFSDVSMKGSINYIISGFFPQSCFQRLSSSGLPGAREEGKMKDPGNEVGFFLATKTETTVEVLLTGRAPDYNQHCNFPFRKLSLPFSQHVNY